jgi:2-keto-3-deoxy-L-rhamnonate aldolase RhmA
MTKRQLSTALRNGELVMGTMVMEFTVPAIGRIAGVAGAEFVLFDMEHTPLTIDRLASLTAAMNGSGVDAWVRVPYAGYPELGRLLDIGVRGVMLPNVQSAAEVARAVDRIKYPPKGNRGVALGLAHDGYRRGDPIETMLQANDATVLVAQLESEAGVSSAADIAAVDGVDVLWVGHNDLTTSLGIPGQFEHQRYLDAIDHVATAARDGGRSGGFRPDSVPHAMDVLARGYRCLAYLSDVAAYRSVLSTGIEEIRAKSELQSD